MAKNLPKKKMGRPPIQLDENLIRELASIHCTKGEIAAVCGVDHATLARYSEIIEIGYEQAKKSLRRLQWESAKKGNTHMLIWLGKQYLGQKDRAPDEVPHTILNVQVNEIP